MKIGVIGGSGHIGSFLVPRLVMQGHEIINITRGQSTPYADHPAWRKVQKVELDRRVEEKKGLFGDAIADLKCDAVIDLICFTKDSAAQLVEALRGKVRHFLHCGTIWVHGYSLEIPTTEDTPRNPFGDYGINKAEAEEYLLDEARGEGFPSTILHPGHIVGPGWWPLNPQGSFNPDVFKTIKRGEPLVLPNSGLETVHHVHADDLAQGFLKALENWSVSVGESFHLTSPKALSLRGYAEAIYSWFGMEPNLEFLPWEELKMKVSSEDAFFIWDHIGHSPCCSIEKAERLLGYSPRYSSLQAVYESLTWMERSGEL